MRVVRGRMRSMRTLGVALFSSAEFCQAIAGQLVPQDLVDEPVSVLLERIRAERAAALGQCPKTTRASKSRQTRLF